MSVPRLRAPKDHGSVLAEPPLARTGSLLDANRELVASARFNVFGWSLAELRDLARREVWAAARDYAHAAGEPTPNAPAEVWLLAGHQPELFHPGVWVKHFALKGLARAHGAFSLNLVVDNDTAKSALLRLPAGDHVTSIPFDHWGGEAPYEERRVLDEELFATLPRRVDNHTRDWGFRPLLTEFWQGVLQQSKYSPLLGERFAAARRGFERRWGCTQAEVTLSRVCQTEAFARFGAQLLTDLPRFHAIYNAAVRDYRRRHGLKSQNHPVPDLAAESDWLELPLWAWRPDQSRRGRLFARRTSAEFQLRSGDNPWPSLPLESERLVVDWRSLEKQGYKIRTRALTTTLFARLLLSDLFIHGIGGGKYDELADTLIERYFGMQAPAFLILSATLLLPLDRPDVQETHCRGLQQLHRDVWYNPQRHLAVNSGNAAALDLMQEKEAWIGRSVSTHEERVARFEKLTEVTAHLRTFLNGEVERIRLERDHCRKELRVKEVLSRRDYAFCLYPEEMLRPFYQSFL